MPMKEETFNRKIQLYEVELEELICQVKMEEEFVLEFETTAQANNYRARIYRYTALLKENKDKERVTPRLYAAACNTMILMRGKKLYVRHRANSPYSQGLKDALARAGGDPNILDPFSAVNIKRKQEEQKILNPGSNPVDRRARIAQRAKELARMETQAPDKLPSNLGFGKLDTEAIEREKQADLDAISKEDSND